MKRMFLIIIFFTLIFSALALFMYPFSFMLLYQIYPENVIDGIYLEIIITIWFIGFALILINGRNKK